MNGSTFPGPSVFGTINGALAGHGGCPRPACHRCTPTVGCGILKDDFLAMLDVSSVAIRNPELRLVVVVKAQSSRLAKVKLLGLLWQGLLQHRDVSTNKVNIGHEQTSKGLPSASSIWWTWWCDAINKEIWHLLKTLKSPTTKNRFQHASCCLQERMGCRGPRPSSAVWDKDDEHEGQVFFAFFSTWMRHDEVL